MSETGDIEFEYKYKDDYRLKHEIISSSKHPTFVGKDFDDMHLEATASLGINRPISVLSESIASVLKSKDGLTQPNSDETEVLQFVLAKLYNNRTSIGHLYISSSTKINPTFTGSINLNSPGHITASGNISSSGDFISKTITTTDIIASGKIKIKGSDITLENGHISASGNISSSGYIQALTGSFGTGTTTITDKISTTGEIQTNTGIKAPGFTASARILTLGSADNEQQEFKVFGKISLKGSDITLMSGSISASGDISASGMVRALTGSFGTGTTTITDKISTTGEIQTNTGIRAPGFTASARILTLGSADDREQELKVFGKLSLKGSDITLMSGSITASGNISSSGYIQALTGSFGTGTTTITDKISTTGEIQTNTGIRAPGFTASARILTLGSSDDREQELKVFGKISLKGSDITLMSGSISASGDISASGMVRALTGSFGTGTTTITDHVSTTGNIYAEAGEIISKKIRAETVMAVSGKSEVNLGTVGDKVDLVVEGKIKIKGSDIVLGGGDISLSGDLVATGSISTDGNITAGTNATGSFDHIVTGQNTIEFRNDAGTATVGYLKFDAVEGIQSLDSDMASISTTKTNQLKTARNIGGVSFNGTKNIELPGVDKAGTQDTSGNAATSTTAANLTGAQASAITANTSKVTFPFTGLKTDTGTSTIAITHQLNKTVHSLLLTVTIPPADKDGKATTKTVTLELK